jgi:hypothetical protein
MSLKVQKLCQALNNDKHHFSGLIVVAFGVDGTTHVDMAGAPEEDVRLFLHGVSVLCSVAAGIKVEQLARKEESSIIVPGVKS